MTQSTHGASRRATPWLLLGSGALFLCACLACATICGAAIAFGWITLPGSSETGLGEPPRTVSDAQKPVDETASAFLQAWQLANWGSAYRLCSPSLQREVRSAAELGTRIEGARSRPTAWRINRITSIREQDTVAEVRATGLFGGQAEPILLQFERVGTEWAISGFRVGN